MPGAYNIDLKALTGVYVGNVIDLSNITTGSQSTIITQNSYGYNPLTSKVSRVLQKGGAIHLTLSQRSEVFGEKRLYPNVEWIELNLCTPRRKFWNCMMNEAAGCSS
ncbi:UNVERIFIED_CONTAM: hypothetical protein Cloal_1286 [Acetivibrio alkalicellulosi]